jgi:hypothetical protein
MKTEIATLWIAALRSGEYRQTQEALKDSDGGLCCLGVLCNLHRGAVPGHEWESETYLEEAENLPDEVAEWAGMKYRPGEGDAGNLPVRVRLTAGSGAHLAVLNDVGASFSEIADVIEKYKDQI